MRAKGIATRGRHRAPWVALGTAFTAMIFGEPARPGDEVTVDDSTIELSDAEIATRAEAATVDLADSLQLVGTSLRSVGSISAGPQGLTKEENARLVESQVKDELERLTRDLDDLQGALAKNGDGLEVAELLQRLSRRKANVIALVQTTQEPLISADELWALAERWKDLDRLSAALRASAGSIPEQAP